jgi:AcrR family transcriptional regulator
MSKKLAQATHLDPEFKPKGRASQVKRGSSNKQASKGAALRAATLKAAVDCLATTPYSEISTLLIADRAGVSRGGMQYYFPTRLDLLRATVSYLHSERLRLFRADLLSIKDHEDVVGSMVDLHWQHLNEKEFRAYQELVLAARSEPELAEMLASSYGGFLDEWHRIARELIGWHAEDPAAARGGNIAHYLLEGMAYGQIAGQLKSKEIEEIKEFAKQILRTAGTRAR